MNSPTPNTQAPIIGITTNGRIESHGKLNDSVAYDEYFMSPTPYTDAVRRAGGVPILLPPGEPNWERWLDIVDGLIIAGGVDVNPERYGGNSAHPDLTTLDLDRDETEIDLMRKMADEKERPILCVCRGMQVMNVALGGSLYEHIPDVVEEDIHRDKKGDKAFWAFQPLEAKKDSQLAQLMQAENVTTFSGHHQAVKDVSEMVEVTALAPDGLIEALAVKDHPWAVGVQWHPEKSAADDPTQQRLFDELVKQAVDSKQ